MADSPSARSSIADFLRKAAEDGPLLDVAVEASLRGVRLDPVTVEVAVQNPRNRDAISRALRALAQEADCAH